MSCCLLHVEHCQWWIMGINMMHNNQCFKTQVCTLCFRIVTSLFWLDKVKFEHDTKYFYESCQRFWYYVDKVAAKVRRERKKQNACMCIPGYWIHYQHRKGSGSWFHLLMHCNHTVSIFGLLSIIMNEITSLVSVFVGCIEYLLLVW